MKKNYLIVFVLLSASAAMGQNSSIKILDSIIVENETKSEFTYITARADEQYLFDWDHHAGIWKKKGKIKYEYHPSGKVSKELFSDWKDASSSWVESGQLELHYSPSGDLAEIISYKWDTLHGYIFESKQERQYGNNHDIRHETSWEWDATNNNWENASKKLFLYNGDALACILKQDWNSSGQWMDRIKDTLVYNGEGYVKESLRLIWDSREQEWRKFEKTRYIYDAAGNNTGQIVSEWEWEGGGSWREEEKTDYFFDTAVDQNSLLTPHDYEWSCKIDRIEKSFTMPFRNNWNRSALINYYYSDRNTLTISEEAPDSILLYPNPASEYVYLDGKQTIFECTFQLYDMQGRKIREEQLSLESGATVSLSGIGPGVYIYRISSKRENRSGKIIKQ